MRSTIALTLLLVAIAACDSPAPTAAPTATASPTAALVPLPENLSGIPTDEESTTAVSPRTPEELAVGEERDYTLGHCGLGSPIDIDGSLWDPVGTGAPLTEQQIGELINSIPVVILLLDENTMEMRTPEGAVVTLTRHGGPRRYFLCD